jgi:glycosyltransferase involved in cell wall biosynthesis
MKIIYASIIDISLPNGPGVNEREFVHALQRRFGDNAGFVIPIPKDPAAMDGLGNCRSYRVWPKRLRYVVAEFPMLWALLRVVREEEPLLVVSRCGLLPIGLAIFAALKRTPIALKTHGDPTLKYLCDSGGMKGFLTRLIRPASLWLSRFLVARAVKVDFCTPQLVTRNLGCHPGVPESKFLMVGNATNVEKFNPGPGRAARVSLGLPVTSRILGYVGGVPWQRGGRHIIKAVAALSKEYPDLIGVIVGGNSSGADDLEAFAEAMGVRDRCVFPGVVPYDDVPRWISSFDIGVAMDLPERAGYVGSSNQKIRQYLASGKPVIAAAGVNEFLEEEALGITVDGHDDRAFRDAVESYLTESAGEAESRSARARRYAEQFFSVDYTLSVRIDAWEKAGIRVARLGAA